ncbi:hypothetical protein QBC37DRAFT_151739 [Rhypophila decipiens]|uniref:Uncharacterized protein n=1 Tax=Rhypophila decipiens TaxID=261697 RepID=A0AAN6YM06_9PEZI|nr:hypothetical protein QBC37DRAFT_151739 [Rhypophila decipiens]
MSMTDSVNEPSSSDTQQQQRRRSPVDQPAQLRGSTTSIIDSVNGVNRVNQPPSSDTRQQYHRQLSVNQLAQLQGSTTSMTDSVNGVNGINGVNQPPSSDTQQQHHHQLPIDQPARPRGSTTSVTDRVNEPSSSDTQQQHRHRSSQPARPPRPTRPLEPHVWAALERVHISEAWTEDAETMDVLYRAFNDLWLDVLEEPDTYVMSDQEFSLFSHFRYLLEEIDPAEPIAKGVTRRYLGNRPGRVGPLATAPGSSR